MNMDYRTSVTVESGFEVNELRPVTTYSVEIQNAMCANSHAHPRAQLISCSSGIMEVVTSRNLWIVNPLQSVWIAENEEHQVYFPNNVKVNSAFIDVSKLGKLPKASFAFDNSAFLKSLLERIVSFSNPERLTPAQHRIVEVFLDELSVLKPSTTFLPTSQDLRIKQVLDSLMDDLSSKHTIDYYAEKSTVSPRTLSRLFHKELGMSFGDWRMRLKLLEAVKQLGEKKPVKEIAFDLGYENVSSFIVAFKKYFGKTPASYLTE